MGSVEDLKDAASGIISDAFRFSKEPPSPEGNRVSWMVDGEGWSAKFTYELRWRGLVGSFVLGGFARPLVDRAWTALEVGSDAGRRLSNLAGSAELAVNGIPFSTALQSANRSTFALTATFAPFEAHEKSGSLRIEEVSPRVSSFLVLVVAMLPELGASALQPQVRSLLEEGEARTAYVKRLERSRVAREICIAVHGENCCVCGMNFGNRYGKLGAGFIHVHHLQPLASATGARPVNPVEDLVPVCPNCHAMMHRHSPPITPAELRQCLEENANLGGG